MNKIKDIYQRVETKESIRIIENYLTSCYLHGPLSNKKLAQTLKIPVPLVTAIKKECIKEDLIVQDAGSRITRAGKDLVEDHLGYKDLDLEKYQALRSNSLNILDFLDLQDLEEIYNNRPKVDYTLDQAHCTLETSLKRCQLAIKNDCIIGKKILCLGDDDLVSLALGFTLKALYKGEAPTEIHVIDVDDNLLYFIQSIATQYDLNIYCHQGNLRKRLPRHLTQSFDCFFTDPPYTFESMDLFLSRGIEALKSQKDLKIFFSFAHRSSDDSYTLFGLIQKLGLTVQQIMPRFNSYLGAGILGSSGQMMVLATTSFTSANKEADYNGKLYTRDFKIERIK